jgi:hypothetical protein
MKRCLTFGLLFLGASLVHAQGILLKSGTIDTSRPLPEIETIEDPASDEIVLVQFPGQVTAEQEKALREASLRVPPPEGAPTGSTRWSRCCSMILLRGPIPCRSVLSTCRAAGSRSRSW